MIRENKFTFILLSLLFISIGSLQGQNFKGRITDINNDPILGGTVLIKHENQGVACNDNGEFQMTLSKGLHKIEYRCLGYETYSEHITIDDDTITYRSIILNEKPITLDEVVVSRKEDPAYPIIRSAIEKAPYHQNVIKEFEAECYIKGEAELTKVSKLIDRFSNIQGLKPSDLKGNLFIQESYNTIHFSAPDQYEQKVIAFSSSAPDYINNRIKMQLATTSIYLPRFAGLISPLHPRAFTYYRFQYEGFIEENGEILNKIRVIPRVKDPELVKGCLYIADTSWDVRFLELEGKIYGIDQQFVMTYDKMVDTIYMPATVSVRVLGKVMGFEGYFNYFSSIKYTDFIINDSIEETIAEVKDKKRDLEIKWNDGYTLKVDSMASKRDDIYWSMIRKTPLSEREIESHLAKDSIQKALSAKHKAYVKGEFKPTDILFGGTVGGKSSPVTFKYGGLFGVFRDYNFVDGFGLGQKFELSTKVGKNNRLTLTPEVYYTVARKDMVWRLDADYEYSPMRLGLLQFGIGDVLSNFNPEGANRFDNATSSLLWGDNVTMLYRQRFMKIKNGIDLTNGLRFVAQIRMDDRLPVHNNTKYSIFGGRSNITENMVSEDFLDLLSYSLSLEYTPRYHYYVRNGKKHYLYATSPTFKLGYTEGFSTIKSDNSRFKRVEFDISQTIRTDQFSNFSYEINTGVFLGNRGEMNYADYKHFNTYDDMWFISKLPYSSFMLLKTFEASTKDYWVYSHVNYVSKYILLKRLPFLQGRLFNEALHLRYLYTPVKRNYMEAGYSIDLLNALSIGVHFSFNQFRYEAVGFRLSLNLDVFSAK